MFGSSGVFKECILCVSLVLFVACTNEVPSIEGFNAPSSELLLDAQRSSSQGHSSTLLNTSSYRQNYLVSSDLRISSSRRSTLNQGVPVIVSGDYSSEGKTEGTSSSSKAIVVESSEGMYASSTETVVSSGAVSSFSIDQCVDGIKNGNERGIDCGIDCGLCTAESWDFYLGNNGDALREYESLVQNGDTEDAGHMAKLAFTPMAQWFGDWNSTATVAKSVDRTLDKAEQSGKPALLVVYAIYGRDCGGFSAGGMASPKAYYEWITEFSNGFEGRVPWIVLEPDGLAMLDEESCDQGERAQLLDSAAHILSSAGGRVYIDVANSGWKTAEERIDLIAKVGTEHLYGFSTNVANTIATEKEKEAAQIIAESTGLHYIIDTGRNGNGSNGEWCNPEGRALGAYPQILNDGFLDAYVWVKGAGWSDGECDDAPAAGKWYPEYALDITRRTLR
ncbi:MAG: glycoside hydrolase family 6 protein [Fibrobacterales bacterium]